MRLSITVAAMLIALQNSALADDCNLETTAGIPQFVVGYPRSAFKIDALLAKQLPELFSQIEIV
jgi:hypothetical protein